MKTTKTKVASKAKIVTPKAPAKAKKASVATPKTVTKKVSKPGLNIDDIKAKANALGITPGKLEKAELIIAIQKAEKNTPCFGTGTPECPYTICCWRIECIS